VLSRVHDARVQETKANEFDIITLLKNDPNRIDQLYHRAPTNQQ
jgi:hypothetical protein